MTSAQTEAPGGRDRTAAVVVSALLALCGITFLVTCLGPAGCSDGTIDSVPDDGGAGAGGAGADAAAGSGGGPGGQSGQGGKGGSGGGGGSGSGGSGGGSDSSLPVVKAGCGIYGNCPTDIYMHPTKRPFANGKELCAWINNCRTAYQFHGRCPGAADSDDPCTPNAGATWPFALAWSPEAGAMAQAEADRIAKGGAPSGTFKDQQLGDYPRECYKNYGIYGLWWEGLGTDRYMVTGKDIGASWEKGCSSLDNSLPYFRTQLAYIDSCGGTKLGHFGCGVAGAGGDDLWAVIVMVP